MERKELAGCHSIGISFVMFDISNFTINVGPFLHRLLSYETCQQNGTILKETTQNAKKAILMELECATIRFIDKSHTCAINANNH